MNGSLYERTTVRDQFTSVTFSSSVPFLSRGALGRVTSDSRRNKLSLHSFFFVQAPKLNVARPGAISNCAGWKPVVGISCVKRAWGNVKLHRVAKLGVRYLTVAFIGILVFNTSR